GKVDYVNPHFLSLTGYTLEEVIGADWVERFIPMGQRTDMTRVFRELLDRELHSHYQNPILTKGGEERMISWNNTVLRDTDGRPSGTLSIAEDITDRLRLEKQF